MTSIYYIDMFLQIMSYIDKLKGKCELVRNWYFDVFDREDPEDIRLTMEEQKLFSSMERFHSLSHTRYEQFFKLSSYCF